MNYELMIDNDTTRFYPSLAAAMAAVTAYDTDLVVRETYQRGLHSTGSIREVGGSLYSPLDDVDLHDWFIRRVSHSDMCETLAFQSR